MRTTGTEEAITASWGRGPCRWSIVVHGGAGDVPENEVGVRIAGCERAAAAGAAVLAGGGSALDAVQRAVELLEDEPIFNAGTGACLNEDGVIELDAAIMDGATLRAGGVCALPPFKNPIAVARRVMDASRHVLLAGEGAASFAIAHGFERAAATSMITESARRNLMRAKGEGLAKGLDDRRPSNGGTVGAVARDNAGHVAAATSTGGMVGKHAGRVGDSPLVGAGTYADDATGACSTTGHGESMIRICFAKMATDATHGMTPETAVRALLVTMHERTAGTGGAILVARNGALGLARSTRAMSWAARTCDGDSASGG